jgi:hypothetical protein
MMIGAEQAGWEEIVGVEQNAGYCRIARARLKHWSRKASTTLLAAARRPRRAANARTGPNQRMAAADVNMT